MRKNIEKLFSAKKYLIALALALMCVCSVFAVTGCGGDDSSSSSSSSSSVEETRYVVTFETNGGVALEPASIIEGDTLVLNDYVPTKEGFYFYGWTLDEACQIRASATMVITENITLYAEWGAEEKYPLSFETNGGSEIQPVMYRPNDYLVEPIEPTKKNCTFAGWYKDAACTEEFSFYAAPQMPQKAMTIYAKWTPINGIVFETNGGTPVETIVGATGDLIVNLAEPTKENYIFEGWYKDAKLQEPYDVVMIPNGLVTVYAKWHEQQKDISVTLHINYGATENTITVVGNEGETLADNEAVATFTKSINDSVKSAYLGDEGDLDAKPIYQLSAWAYDSTGHQRFEGKLPHKESIDLYAVWSRTATYCEITFIEEEGETSYFVAKNSVLDEEVFERHTSEAKEMYEQLGCMVDGFYTVGGNRYVKGGNVAMDMRLIPYVYTADLSYQYVTKKTATDSELKGYALKGYLSSKADQYKEKDSLLLLIPEFYNDGSHGQLPVIWVEDSAFNGFNVSEVRMPNSIMGIGAQAFSNTKLETIDLPMNLYYLGDDAFTGSAQLATVNFNSEISHIGATIFKNTPYEATMPRNDDGFVFFDSKKTSIYGYEGTKMIVTTPSTARNIAGGAFKDNKTIKQLTLNDGIRYVSDYAFENSVIESVTLGKFFASMGVGVFKNCKNLTTVQFASRYNLATIGEGMFEGCSALKNINLLELANLQEVKARAFYGCSSLENVVFSDKFLTLGESAFEKCSTLVYVDFGESENSAFNSIGNRAFADCTSLRRIILRGNLINNTIVKFGQNVFSGAGYNKNGRFVTPVIYVKDMTVDNWSVDDEFQLYTYVEIYKMRLPSEYASIVVKAIDSRNPEVIVSGAMELSSSAELASFDLLDYLLKHGVTVTDDTSAAQDCVVYIQSVVNANGQTLVATNGKYNIRAQGTYTVKLVAEDEFGNKTETQAIVIVK